MSFVARCFQRGLARGRYTNGLLPPEDPAFGAKPRPECSANFFLGRTHVVVVGVAQAPPPLEPPPTAEIPPYTPSRPPPPPKTTPCPPPPPPSFDR